ncbi:MULTISPECIES: UDP-N-acetylmuramoyl-tripeptide--D-alanyl-D-alanine ligase [Pasteurellaceae]|uniref:UDP-N-acetylmuramoyl-tripeptide--D-alanyl-D-alanine ligase n=1 Tax=Pasteurella atlantica TaxID=2827233 RepID=A0AAW8CHR4_9PAST|nr:UDP-N-acetylmuramoyl-tripeptide--D-alanyl-D-alanine ligase [Pasteurella atlantica]MBR0573519.1 UDP-N-acetylmuramoyl-tripeptide--D-alanyl-D-alanine ligase [Pasteurella atlantica]MDP8039520.1 UDP-N-acetylmuramoyl-tripeptide--D-alanyl-D-alanine ligase [Pasteurella atlantica]MDP8041611.1 UDP-N-acetylmuramoyl-tripeptide--D-alanyl-D-alanine ligase [Pasteurella atlantica]MDP8043748.1 UDP-N-acetylmuramoyl-tripeptide--D-alanyl-D-alanine ligase [Pasteurella atlantica]MDP8045755.1 UDP-N-acetylmuramoyl
MIKLNLNTIANILAARLVGDKNISVDNLFIENISTDTRQAIAKGLFFALKGENFDAHNYLSQAVKQGCVAVVVEREMDVNVPQLIVEDTALALGKLGKWLKAKINPKTVAITGSSGKTTVKEMVAKILQNVTACSDEVLFTFGNLNNDLGVPLTLLRLNEKHKFAIVELGANHLGEIAYTVDLVKPDACLINNVTAAHLEGFGSLEGVAEAKSEIYQGLADDGTAIVNLDYPQWRNLWQQRIINRKTQTFSANDQSADFYAKNIQLTLSGANFILGTPQGEIEIHSSYLGEHNISNALAAASLAMAVGADLKAIKSGLEQHSKVKGRLYPIEINENLLLIDDTYNANVGSLKSAISVLKNYPAFRILAVADMGELGSESKQCHQQVADFVKEAKLDLVVSFGKESAVISNNPAHHFTEKQTICDFLMPIILQKSQQKQPLVLLAKGSRSQKMEELIALLVEQLKNKDKQC